MNIIYQSTDLTKKQKEDLLSSPDIAIDTELTGIDVKNDTVCLIQLRGRDSDNFYLIQIKDGKEYPNLVEVLTDKNTVKIFHYARMDLLMIYKRFGVWTMPVFCTKIAVVLARPKKGNSLRNVLLEIFKIEIEKDQTCSDWTKKLNKDQKRYAANDVLYLHQLKDYLEVNLKKKKLMELAQKTFEFIPTRCLLDLALDERDIFHHNPKIILEN